MREAHQLTPVKRKSHTAEASIKKLREAATQIAEGKKAEAAARQIGPALESSFLLLSPALARIPTLALLCTPMRDQSNLLVKFSVALKPSFLLEG